MKARPATTAPAPTHTQAIELLRATHLFSSLAELDLTNLAASCDTRDLAGGELLITQGEPGDDLFVVVSGKFRVSHTGPGGDELVLGDVMAGAWTVWKVRPPSVDSFQMLLWVPVPHGPLSYHRVPSGPILMSGSPYAWVGSTTTALPNVIGLGVAAALGRKGAVLRATTRMVPKTIETRART